MNKYFKLILILLCSATLGAIFGFSNIHMETKDWIIIYLGTVIIGLLIVILGEMNNLNSLYKGEYSKAIEQQLAKEYFSKASKSEYENYFSKKAEEYLKKI